MVGAAADGEPYNTEAIWLAAYLHDWGGYPKGVQPGVEHYERSRKVAAAFPARIAALPDEGPTEGFRGRDHDRILYGPGDTPSAQVTWERILEELPRIARGFWRADLSCVRRTTPGSSSIDFCHVTLDQYLSNSGSERMPASRHRLNPLATGTNPLRGWEACFSAIRFK